MENENKTDVQSDKKSIKEKLGILFKRYFITGLIIIIPLWFTFFVVVVIFNWVSSFTFPILKYIIADKAWLEFLAKFISFFISVASICLLGFLTNKIIGKTLLSWIEKLIERVPLVGTVYSSAKQLVSFLFRKDKTDSFKEVVFIPYPTKGVYSVGFKIGNQKVKDEVYVSVFMPTTPNPTTGFLFMFKEKDVVYTDYTIDQAFQFIISLGVITMGSKKAKANSKELQQKIKEIKDEL